MNDVEQLIEQGREAFKRQNWKVCIDSYTRAIALDPTCRAVELRQMAMRVIEFYNKDMYNP